MNQPYRIQVISGPHDSYLNHYRGTLVQCLKMARFMNRRHGQVSTIIRPDGSDMRKPTKVLPLP